MTQLTKSDRGMGFLDRLSGLGLSVQPALLLLWGCVFFVDAYLRFLGDAKNVNVVLLSQQTAALTSNSKLSTSRYDHYLSKIVQPRDKEETANTNLVFAEPVAAVPVVDIPTGQDVWNTGQFHFKLLAIFSGGERFAVLERFEPVTGTKRIVEFRVGDAIDEYSVNKISNHQVFVTGLAGERAELKLFEPILAKGDRVKFKKEQPSMVK